MGWRRISIVSEWKFLVIWNDAVISATKCDEIIGSIPIQDENRGEAASLADTIPDPRPVTEKRITLATESVECRQENRFQSRDGIRSAKIIENGPCKYLDLSFVGYRCWNLVGHWFLLEN